MASEQAIVIFSLVTGISSLLLLYYYSFKTVDEYCCLSETVELITKREDIVKPPNWSAILAARVEYIDRTALVYAQKLYEELGRLIEEKTGLRVVGDRWLMFKLIYLLLTGKKKLWNIFRKYNSIKKRLRKASIYFHSGKNMDKYRLLVATIIRESYEAKNILSKINSL